MSAKPPRSSARDASGLRCRVMERIHPRIDDGTSLALQTLTLCSLSLGGFALLLFAMRWGAGITPDSVDYLTTAANLARGRGLSFIGPDGTATPLTIFAPLYPTVLAAISLIGADTRVAVVWLQAVLLAANVLLVGLFLRIDEPRNAWVPVIGSLLFLTSDQMLAIHATALSEALFLTFTLGSLCLLTAYFDAPRTWLVVGAGVLVGLAAVTRYQAIALSAGGALGICALSRTGVRTRVFASVAFLGCSLLPVASWFVRNTIVSGNPAAKNLAVHPITVSYLWQGLVVVTELIIPEPILRQVQRSLPGWLELVRTHQADRALMITAGVAVIGAVMVMLVAADARFIRGSGGWSQVAAGLTRALAGLHLTRGAKLVLAYAGSYVGLAVIVISIADAGVELNLRILVLFVLCALVLAAEQVPLIMRSIARGGFAHTTILTIAVLVLASYPLRGLLYVVNAHRDGIGFNSVMWRDSAVLQKVRALPGSVRVYTNGGSSVVYFWTGRMVHDLPEKFDDASGLANPTYQEELSEVEQEVKHGTAAAVYLKGMATPSGKELAKWPSDAELRALIPKELVELEPDGWVAALPTTTVDPSH